jgi:serine/threonine protein kinase
MASKPSHPDEMVCFQLIAHLIMTSSVHSCPPRGCQDKIGEGSTSKCFRCIRKADGVEFACKVLDKRIVETHFAGLLEQFKLEIEVLRALQHPSIVTLEDSFETVDRIYMVLEKMDGGELFDYVVDKQSLSEEEASVIIRNITSAIHHMHAKNM